MIESTEKDQLLLTTQDLLQSHALGWMSLALGKVVTHDMQMWHIMYERNLEYNNKVDSLKDIVVEFVAYL